MRILLIELPHGYTLTHTHTCAFYREIPSGGVSESVRYAQTELTLR